MNPSHRPWSAQAGATPEQNQSNNARPPTTFGPGAQQSPTSAPSLPPPNSQFPYQQASHQSGLPGMNHVSPRQGPSSLQRPEPAPQQGPGFNLPALSQATGQPSLSDRERERAREAEHIHIKEESDRHHRELERQRMEQAHPGPPIHLHQPVAVGPRSVHGPNGLLAQPGIGAPAPQSQLPQGAPNGSGFQGGMMQPNGQAAPGQPGMLMPFVPGAQPTSQPMAQGPGQQPILNDALSYLDQVKVQFSDHPDVYNRFLDIMKDFKGGVIDTPGVIGRVSQLFAGNPGLIQGFNTFLPPGYRIECGEGDDPNVIRVTTPAGTSLQSIPGTGGRPLSRQDGAEPFRRANGIFTPQPGQPQIMMSPSGRAVGPVMPSQQYMSAVEHARQQQEQQAMHQQEQRGVSHLQNAVSNAAAGGLRAGMSPVPGRATPMAGADGMNLDGAGQSGLEKRGPVEFNHAISYVNKIKTRFASQPDIYKQFLEILQTYQRENKPIQDVYSQVTHLFKTAPDLLDDFKQFLPETAAQAKAAMQARQQAEENTMLSNMRGEPIYASPVISREIAMGTPHGRGLPPVGNFAPTPNAKDNKRKRNDRQGALGNELDGFAAANTAKAQIMGPAGKRIKQTHGMVKVMDQPPTSPTLIPALPSALPPTSTSQATNEELNFFDRAKKAISNKNTFNEFLKLCNLYSQDLLERTTLIYRARAFIGGHADLMKWFIEFVGYDEKDITIENKPNMPGGRISLSNCRSLGPSYRMLPKLERNKPCSGRDELCREVLNDDWASHPTWASEDSGFIAHKKNAFEEALHRIEEERHDYDFNIETCARTIQLLEPIAQQLATMTDAEQQAFTLPHGIGGQSESIYKRVIYKCYGRARGNEVVEQLMLQPYVVVPVMLNRLKERRESWQLAQREWEKVWRDQTQRMYWKSLDHQHLAARNIDKRAFQQKTLTSELAVRREEYLKQDATHPGTSRQPHYEIKNSDIDTVIDAAHLTLLYMDQTLATEVPNLATWFREFIAVFYGLSMDTFSQELSNRKAAVDLTDAENLDELDEEPSRRTLNNKALTSLRDASREGSQASPSRATTPGDVSESAQPSTQMDTEMPDRGNGQWLDHPPHDNVYEGRQVNPNEPYTRSSYTLWGGASLYCMLRIFAQLADRLAILKAHEADCSAAVEQACRPTAAQHLGLVDRLPNEFFASIGPDVNYYSQMLHKFEDVALGKLDFIDVEEVLRRFYLSSGFGLYAFEKMLQGIARFASNIVAPDGKERSMDAYQQFKRDRARDTTTARQQTEYRRAAEKLLKDSDLYRIVWEPEESSIKVWLTKKDDMTYLQMLSSTEQESKWRWYVASYTSLAPTEGVDATKMQRTVLPRNLRAMGVDAAASELSGTPSGDSVTEDQVQRRLNNARAQEHLVFRVAVNSYQPIYQSGTADWWYMTEAERSGGVAGITEAANILAHRNAYVAGLSSNNNAMAGLDQAVIENAEQAFDAIVA